jgi:hypothetical protein
MRSLAGASRPASWTAASDALRITVHAAREAGGLREAAHVDSLVLRARFTSDGEIVRRRTTPFVERSRGPDGVTRWAVKGPGANARVRVIERRDAA